ncbi:MAG: hypothetical protein JWM28_1637 [Chitinophagaceae bacterium]|nr:hypothetical protein [Chitinophagaceae bacterium]
MIQDEILKSKSQLQWGTILYRFTGFNFLFSLLNFIKFLVIILILQWFFKCVRECLNHTQLNRRMLTELFPFTS